MPATADGTAAADRRPPIRLWRLLEGARALDLSVLLIGVSTAVLTAFGLVMVLSSSSVEAIGTGQGSYGLFLRQLMWAGIGAAALAAMAVTPVRVLKGFAWGAIGIAIILLALVGFTPLGVSVGGNTNWLALGGLRVQPSEAAKLALALWAGAVLERKGRLTTRLKHALLPVVPVAGLLILLVLKGRDLGTALILALIVMVILFVAGTHRGVFSTSAAVLGVGTLAMTLLAPHRLVRVQAWLRLDGVCDLPTDPCFQSDHGLYALASGGWWGVGLGQSRQKWSYIPEAENDFIFTILGEELGLLGTLAVLAAFAALAVGMYRVASGTTSTFIRLTTWGILAWLVGQAVVNIAMVSGLLPVVGVPLPFISYGGSALTLCLTAVGVVLSFARHERRRAAELAGAAAQEAGVAAPAAAAAPDAPEPAASPAPEPHTDGRGRRRPPPRRASHIQPVPEPVPDPEPDTDPLPILPAPQESR